MLHCAYFGTQAVLIGKRLLVVAGEVELGFDWGRKKKRMQSWQTRDFVATLGNRNKCKHQVNRFGFWDRKDQLGSNIFDVRDDRKLYCDTLMSYKFLPVPNATSK